MKQFQKLKNLLLALTVSAILGETLNHAASRLTEDLTELLKRADAVVQVSVKTQHVQTNNAQGVPFTVVTLCIEKSYKGTLSADTEIQAEYFGGALEGETVVCPGQPKMDVGERAVLLLARVPGAQNWRILGGDAGQIVLVRDGSGQELARRGCGQFDFYLADESSLTGYRPVKGTAIFARQLGALLQAVLDTGRPVLEKQQAASAIPLPVAAAIATSQESSVESTAGRILLVILATTLVWAASRILSIRQKAKL
jgi:hypothetical protein